MSDFFIITILLMLCPFLIQWVQKTIDLFCLFITCKVISLISILSIISEVYTYNSVGILILILYIISLKILKSVIRVLLLIAIKRNENAVNW